MSTDLREILAYLREDLGGDQRKAPVTPRGHLPSSHSSSSQEKLWLRRERRPPRQLANDLRDIKFDPPRV